MKKTKLFTTLAAFVLVLGLGACDTSSESTDSGSTSEETSESTESGTTEGGTTEAVELSNYTLSIGIIYQDELEAVPDYATAYIQGGWDSWAEWLPLTASEDGRYEYTFSSIEVGTYEFQLVLDYDDTNIGYTYRVTNSNASFTVKEEDGDDYKNQVTIEASATLASIIPDPSSFISNVKVTFDITLDNTSQDVLSYGTLWIEGSWDWNEGFVACTVENNKYVYTFDKLAPIEYEFLGVIYYSDEDLPTDNTVWNYKVNGDANGKFTVQTSSVNAELVATKALAEILPEPSEGGSSEEKVVSNFTISVTFTDATTGTTALAVPDGDTVYFAGSFDVDEWSSWVTSTDYQLTLDESKTGTYVYTYIFSQITTGEYEIEFLFCETGTIDWGHSLGKATFTVTSDNQDYSITHQTNYDDLSTVIQAIGADTNFYVLYVDSGSTSVDSISSNVAAANWGCGVNSPAEGASITYNGSGATATTASNSKTVIYSNSYFTASSHANVWCTLYSGSWNPQSGTNGIEVPENVTGTYAVYIGEVTLTNWASNSGTQNVWDNTGVWVTGVDSIETVINNLASYYSI